MAFRGKVAVITGGGSGMGQLSAWRLAAQGATVAIVDLNEAGMEKTKQGYPNIHSYVCDVSNLNQVNEVISQIVENHGPIDRLTHAAAIMPMAKIADMPAENIVQLMRINYDGTVFLTKAVLPSMLERDTGDIILYGSLAGNVLSPKMGAYGATKSATNTFAESLIRESKSTKLRIVLMCPPVVNTPLLSQGVQGDENGWLAFAKNKRIMLEPSDIVDCIENTIEKGSAIIYPGMLAKLALWVRKISPSLSWRFFEGMDGVTSS